MEKWLSTSIFYIAQVPLVLFLTVFLLLRYPARLPGLGTPWYVYGTVGLTWVLSFLALVLLPADLAETLFRRCEYLNRVGGSILALNQQPCAPPSLSPAALLATWQVLYWTSLVLGWVLLPLVQSGLSSEYLPLRERFRKAFRPKFFVLITVAVMLSAIAAAVRSPAHHGLEPATWRATIIGLNNAFGLFLLMIFLGFGLVEVPRTLWQRADLNRRLRYYVIRLAELDERRFETLLSLSRLRAQAASLRLGHAEELSKTIGEQEHAASGNLPGFAMHTQKRSATARSIHQLYARIESLLRLVPLDVFDVEAGQRNESVASQAPPLPILADQVSLCSLYVEMRNCVLEYRRTEFLWQQNCNKALFFQDVLQWRDSTLVSRRESAVDDSSESLRWPMRRCRERRSSSADCGNLPHDQLVSTSCQLDLLKSDEERSRREPGHQSGWSEVSVSSDGPWGSDDPEAVRDASDAASAGYWNPVMRSENPKGHTKSSLRRLVWYWHAYGQPAWFRAQALLLVLVVSAVFLSEITIWTVLLTPPRSFSLFARALHQLPLSPMGVQAVALGLVCALTLLVYFAIFHLQIYRWYELVPGHVDGNMLCLNATLMSRFLLPLCYHLIFLLHENREAVTRLLHHQYPQMIQATATETSTVPVTAFETLMGSMHIVPLFGQAFNYFYPCTLLFLVLGTYFRIWSRLMGRLGFRSFQFTKETESGTSYEALGKQLLARERARRQRHLASSGLNDVHDP